MEHTTAAKLNMDLLEKCELSIETKILEKFRGKNEELDQSSFSKSHFFDMVVKYLSVIINNCLHCTCPIFVAIVFMVHHCGHFVHGACGTRT